MSTSYFSQFCCASTPPVAGSILLKNDKLTPILHKKKGSRDIKAVYTDEGTTRVENVETSQEERVAFVLSDREILTLARWGCIIEDHYVEAMDVECDLHWKKWTRDSPKRRVKKWKERVIALSSKKRRFA